MLTNSIPVRLFLCLALLLPTWQGCTYKFLRHNYTHLVQSLNDILYQQVLDNLAMFECNSGALPSFAVVGSGSAQVSDARGGSTGLTWNPTTLVSEAAGLTASRTLVETWGATPVMDPGKLRRLRCGFQLIIDGATSYIEVQECPSQKDLDGKPIPAYRVIPSTSDGCLDCIRELIECGFLTPPSKDLLAKSGTLDFKQLPQAEKYQQDLLTQIECKLPRGWYCVGKPCDVPRNAAFVGRYGKVVVWVEATHVDYLSRATLSMLDLATRETPKKAMVTVKHTVEGEGVSTEFTGEIQGDITQYARIAEVIAAAQRLVDETDENKANLLPKAMAPLMDNLREAVKQAPDIDPSSNDIASPVFRIERPGSGPEFFPAPPR
ncbi:hypothetical protein [Planctopirus hydrillae]|uniref:Uncharacterized protein n=1 Tax=Planctopirus hydrillae TaxID=1841610 RepID=A0A1C3E7R8_9PLAN|nr:hypothetical protein [Planctopirus hydrillae]ODA29271.1 hypothetical protein A6X21_09225 [Planctopirus hydrillae]